MLKKAQLQVSRTPHEHAWLVLDRMTRGGAEGGPREPAGQRGGWRATWRCGSGACRARTPARRLRRWHCFCSVVKNPKRRFRFTADIKVWRDGGHQARTTCVLRCYRLVPPGSTARQAVGFGPGRGAMGMVLRQGHGVRWRGATACAAAGCGDG